MATLVLDPQPAEIEQLLERRRASGADRWDEVWKGVLHVIPPPSHQHQRLAVKLVRALDPLADEAGLELTAEVGIGTRKDDFRAPDLAIHRPGAAEQWHPTAALVVEIVSPGDKTWEKLDFYADHGVDEIVVVDPQERKVHWFALTPTGEYRRVTRSGLIDLGPVELAERLGWAE